MSEAAEEPIGITPDREAATYAGNVRVRVVRAGIFRPDAGSFFGVVPRALWSRLVDIDEEGRLRCRLNLLLIEAAGKRVLVETGLGARLGSNERTRWGLQAGDAATALRELGEDPASIDYVIVSHLHRDHAGGLVDAAGRPSFARAEYVVQRSEVDAARGDQIRVRGAMDREALDAIDAAGQLRLVEGDVDVVPGVAVLRTGGHTQGSQAVLIGTAERTPSAGGRAVFFGDLVPARWKLPVRWTSAHDDYPVEAVEEKQRLMSRAAADGWQCYFTHDPGTLPIRIEKAEGGFRELQD